MADGFANESSRRLIRGLNTALNLIRAASVCKPEPVWFS